MPEGKGYGPQNTASAGLSLNIIGNHCFGFSGEITVNNNTVSQFEFTTGSEYISAKYQFGFDSTNMSGSDRLGYIVQFNNVKVYEMVPLIKWDYAIMAIDPLRLIIPPYTTVKIESTTTEGANVGTYGVISGRLYK